MAVFRVEKTKNYTVMANHHLKDRRLSLRSKGLLSVMLSLPEEWDYTLKGLAVISKEGVDAIGEAVKELERAGYIIRSRQRDDHGRLRGMEYVIYEQPQQSGTNPPGRENPVQVKPAQVKPAQAKPVQASPAQAEPEQAAPAQENPPQSIPQKEIIKISSTQASNPDPINPDPPFDMESVRRLVRRNLSYDVLVQDERFPAGRLDEIVDLITETLCSRRETMSVAGDEYPARAVKDKLLRLNSLHIEYVLNCLDRNTTQVHNIKKYLLATLFNAPSTIDSYYAALVNHDLYGGATRRGRDDDELPF